MRALFHRIAGLFQRHSLDARMDEEIDSHIAAATQENIRRGMDPASARTAALRDFGGVTQAREEHREARGFMWFDTLAQDLRFARRTLLKAPGFVLSAVLILGLAIGANTTLFTFFDGYVLRPIAISNADRNYEINCKGKNFYDSRWSLADYRALAANHDVFTGTYAYTEKPLPVLEPRALRAQAAVVSGNYFALLGGRTIMGRPILPDDDTVPGRDAVAVVTVTGWQRLFGGDANVVGKTLRVRDRVFRIVGVSDAAFSGTSPLIPDLWFPAAMYDVLFPEDKVNDAEHRLLHVGGVLQPGLRPGAASDRMTQLVIALNDRHTKDNAVTSVTFDSKATYIPMRGDILSISIPMFVLFGLVLLIACADLANLLLARGAARQREIAVRLALGASRGRIIRQLLTESILLSLLGGIAGCVIAVSSADQTLRYLMTLLTKQGYHIQPLATDWRIFAFTLGVAVLAGIAFGLAPALEASRSDLTAGMKPWKPRRLTDVLVSAQVAASLVLMVMASLLIRNARHVSNVDPGYNLDALADINLDGPADKLIERMKLDPRFGTTSRAFLIPASGQLRAFPARVSSGKSLPLAYNLVDEHFFETIGIPIRDGRGFLRPEAQSSARIVVVSEKTARMLWPASNAIGQTFVVPNPQPGDRYAAGTYQVVGIAGDVVTGFFSQGLDSSMVYFPAPSEANLLVSFHGDPTLTMESLRKTCGELDRNSSCDPLTLRQFSEFQVFPFLVAGNVSVGLGALALILTSVGLYGVVAFSVAQRNKEIGIRIALGATAFNVLRFVMARSTMQVLLGIAVGAPICLALTKLLISVVWMLKTFEWLPYVAVPALLVAVAMFAAFLPARRATRVDPMVVLRDE